jgi:3-oxoacyl-[acyl-carrier protein] reductase
MGRSTAFTLAREGADIVLNYGTFRTDRQAANHVASAIRKMGRKVLIARADTTRPAQVQRMISQTLSTFGRLDILVNNAGGAWEQTELTEVDPEHWRLVLEAEINGAFYTMRYAVPAMRKQKWGRIVNIGWHDAEYSAQPPYDYSIGKAARHLLAWKLAAAELKNGITINNVCPGAIPPLEFDQAVALAADPRERARHVKPNPQDIAEAVAFLCSEAARFVTASRLVILGRDALK